MTLFSSKPPVNDDPKPYIGHNDDRDIVSVPGLYPRVFSSRPEFDRPQHNPTNPILTEFRKYAEGRVVYLARHWIQSEFMWSEMVLEDTSDDHLGSPEQEDHARKVITRLAALEKVA